MVWPSLFRSSLPSVFPPAVTETQYLTEVAAGLFGHAGEQGDHNALYTYAQLLRTGGCTAGVLPPMSGILSFFQAKVCRWILPRLQRCSGSSR